MKMFFIASIVSFAMVLPGVSHAQNFVSELNNTGVEVYGGENAPQSDLYSTISQVLAVLFSVLGIILLLLIIYAGFLWMTAGGNSDQVSKAKSIMVNAVIGLVIILLSWTISSFVVDELETLQTNSQGSEVG